MSSIRETKSVDSSAGVVVGAPRRWLALEAATLLTASLIAYSVTHEPWWIVPVALLVPDSFMVGYLNGPTLGARVYNLAHSTPLPALMVGLGWWQATPLVAAFGLIWLAHIGMDRLLGFGLKYSDRFQHTHLGDSGGTRHTIGATHTDDESRAR
jgi:Domain of unknown function (DUF4260)